MPDSTTEHLNLPDALAALPPEWPDDPLPAVRAAMARRREKVVVLDDDPTGTQTVHGVTVVTDWSVESLARELDADDPAVFVLTNSRSLTAGDAGALGATIGRNLQEAGARSDRDYVVVSRSDSTLRGHFPDEVDSLAVALGQELDGWLIVPFFLEGGRYTLDDIHYVAEGDRLVPAGETEFARDAAFEYRSSNLKDWVEEKTRGRLRSGSVASVSITDIREGGPARVAQRLGDLSGGQVCVVNAASMRDLEVFVLGLLDAERDGKRFLYRTAASFVRARLGQEARAILTSDDLGLPESGGCLVVVGSHVPRTTGQLEHLLGRSDIVGVEVSVGRLLSEGLRSQEIARVAGKVDGELGRGKDVAVFTSRQVVAGDRPEDSLEIGKRVSDGVSAIVAAVTTRPRYMIAKGGITASDIATRALGVRRVTVPGQILAGVPIWELGPESRFPGLKYVVFPGNVGGPEALSQVLTGLRPGDGPC